MFIDKNEKKPEFVDKNEKKPEPAPKEDELREVVFKRKRGPGEFKWLGKNKSTVKKHWMLTEEIMLKRAFETVFGNGLNHRKIDKKRIPPLHYDILVSCGYAKNLPNLGVCILTDKAFEDKDKILCKNG